MTSPIVVVDTSGLVAAIDRGSESHEETKAVLDDLHTDRDARLLVSPFVLAEADYLISVRLGRPDRAVRLLEDVARGAYRLEPFSASDLECAVEVMR